MTEKDGGVWTYKYDTRLGVLNEIEDPDPYEITEKYAYFQSGINTGRLQYIEDNRGRRPGLPMIPTATGMSHRSRKC